MASTSRPGATICNGRAKYLLVIVRSIECRFANPAPREFSRASEAKQSQRWGFAPKIAARISEEFICVIDVIILIF
jgi:hypothetical protein